MQMSTKEVLDMEERSSFMFEDNTNVMHSTPHPVASRPTSVVAAPAAALPPSHSTESNSTGQEMEPTEDVTKQGVVGGADDLSINTTLASNYAEHASDKQAGNNYLGGEEVKETSSLSDEDHLIQNAGAADIQPMPMSMHVAGAPALYSPIQAQPQVQLNRAQQRGYIKLGPNNDGSLPKSTDLNTTQDSLGRHFVDSSEQWAEQDFGTDASLPEARPSTLNFNKDLLSPIPSELAMTPGSKTHNAYPTFSPIVGPASQTLANHLFAESNTKEDVDGTTSWSSSPELCDHPLSGPKESATRGIFQPYNKEDPEEVSTEKQEATEEAAATPTGAKECKNVTILATSSEMEEDISHNAEQPIVSTEAIVKSPAKQASSPSTTADGLLDHETPRISEKSFHPVSTTQADEVLHDDGYATGASAVSIFPSYWSGPTSNTHASERSATGHVSGAPASHSSSLNGVVGLELPEAPTGSEMDTPFVVSELPGLKAETKSSVGNLLDENAIDRYGADVDLPLIEHSDIPIKNKGDATTSGIDDSVDAAMISLGETLDVAQNTIKTIGTMDWSSTTSQTDDYLCSDASAPESKADELVHQQARILEKDEVKPDDALNAGSKDELSNPKLPEQGEDDGNSVAMEDGFSEQMEVFDAGFSMDGSETSYPSDEFADDNSGVECQEDAHSKMEAESLIKDLATERQLESETLAAATLENQRWKLSLPEAQVHEEAANLSLATSSEVCLKTISVLNSHASPDEPSLAPPRMFRFLASNHAHEVESRKAASEGVVFGPSNDGGDLDDSANSNGISALFVAEEQVDNKELDKLTISTGTSTEGAEMEKSSSQAFTLEMADDVAHEFGADDDNDVDPASLGDSVVGRADSAQERQTEAVIPAEEFEDDEAIGKSAGTNIAPARVKQVGSAELTLTQQGPAHTADGPPVAASNDETKNGTINEPGLGEPVGRKDALIGHANADVANSVHIQAEANGVTDPFDVGHLAGDPNESINQAIVDEGSIGVNAVPAGLAANADWAHNDMTADELNANPPEEYDDFDDGSIDLNVVADELDVNPPVGDDDFGDGSIDLNVVADELDANPPMGDDDFDDGSIDLSVVAVVLGANPPVGDDDYDDGSINLNVVVDVLDANPPVGDDDFDDDDGSIDLNVIADELDANPPVKDDGPDDGSIGLHVVADEGQAHHEPLVAAVNDEPDDVVDFFHQVGQSVTSLFGW